MEYYCGQIIPNITNTVYYSNNSIYIPRKTSDFRKNTVLLHIRKYTKNTIFRDMVIAVKNIGFHKIAYL